MPELKRILVAEFKTKELMKDYSNISYSDIENKSIAVVHIINPDIDEDENLVMTNGWCTDKQVQEFTKALNESSGGNVQLMTKA